MAFVHYESEGPMSGSRAVFLFKERMKIAGWEVAGSGGGAEGWFSASSDGISQSGSGPGGIDETNAWFRIANKNAEPTREFLLQRGTNSTRWNVYYSSDGVGFVSGSPGASTLPTAADGKQLVFGDQWFENNEQFFVDMFFGDKDEEFSFGFYSRRPGNIDDGSNIPQALFLDVLSGAHPSDPDPAVVILAQNGTSAGFKFVDGFFEVENMLTPASDRDLTAYGWIRKNDPNEEFVPFGASCWGQEGGGGMVNAMEFFEQNPYNGSWDSWPIFFIRSSDSLQDPTTRKIHSAYKGKSRIFRLNSAQTRDSTLSRDKTRVYFGQVSLPFSGNFILS